MRRRFFMSQRFNQLALLPGFTALAILAPANYAQNSVALSQGSVLNATTLTISTSINLSQGAILNAPALTRVTGTVALSQGAVCNAASLATVDGNLVLNQGATLNAPRLSKVGGSVTVQQGARLNAPLLVRSPGAQTRPNTAAARAPAAQPAPRTAQPKSSTPSLWAQAMGQYNLKNYTQAFALFLKSAQQGDARGEDWVASLYQVGQGVTKDPVQALAWFQKAAAQNNSDAMNHLGVLYRDGVGVPRNYAQALIWYQKAAAQGDANAETNMGEMYEDGVGVGADFAQALNLYRKAAAQGFAIAENNIGYMYQYGQGVAANPNMARAWYQKAAAQGQSNAIQNLAMLNAAAPAAQPAPAPQQTAPQQGQGVCAAVYITGVEDSTYGAHWLYGAAWSRSTLNEAESAAQAELMTVAAGADPRVLPGGQYAPSPATGSGCTYAHGAVAGKLKIAPGGCSMFNSGCAAGTSILGAGIYDAIVANFAGSADAAVSAAMSLCHTTNGSGDNDDEVCNVLEQW